MMQGPLWNLGPVRAPLYIAAVPSATPDVLPTALQAAPDRRRVTGHAPIPVGRHPDHFRSFTGSALQRVRDQFTKNAWFREGPPDNLGLPAGSQRDNSGCRHSVLAHAVAFQAPAHLGLDNLVVPLTRTLP